MEITEGVAMFVVYFSPKGFAGMFVMQPWFALDGKLTEGRPRPGFTLQEAREQIPAGCTNLGRCGPDDEDVLETWI